MNLDNVKKFIDVAEETIDWWNYSASPSEGDEVIKKLNEILSQVRYEYSQCLKNQKSIQIN